MRKGWVFATMAGIGIIAGLGVVVAHRVTERTVETTSLGWDNTGASSMRLDKPALERLMQHSELVLDVRVVSVGAAAWTTPDGSPPTLDFLRSSRHQNFPVTPLTLQVNETFRGSAARYLVLWVPGGHPARTMPNGLHDAAEDEPMPAVGTEMVLFLGKPVDWRYGEGVPLPGREGGGCTLTPTTVTCGHQSISRVTLEQVLHGSS